VINGPKDLLSVSICLIGVVLIICMLLKVISLVSISGYAGLSYAKLLTLIVGFILGCYMLKEENYFFKIGVKGTNSSFECEFTRDNVFLFGLKIIGVILIVFQITSLLDLTQFFLSNSGLIDTPSFIWSLITGIALVLFGYYLLRSGRIFYKIAFNSSSR